MSAEEQDFSAPEVDLANELEPDADILKRLADEGVYNNGWRSLNFRFRFDHLGNVHVALGDFIGPESLLVHPDQLDELSAGLATAQKASKAQAKAESKES